MADFSALTAAQASAEQVPYKNIALGNPAETFLNAWQMATNVRLKKSELEGKMAALAAKNRQMELDSQLDRAKFGLAMQKMEIDSTHKGNMYDLAAQRLGLDKEKQDMVVQKYGDIMEGQHSLNQLQTDAANQGLRQGTKEYADFINAGLAGLTGRVPSSELNNVRRSTSMNQNAAIAERRKASEFETQRFYDDVGRQLYGGNTTLQNMEDIINWEQLKDAPAEGGSWFPYEAAKPSNKKLVWGPDVGGKMGWQPKSVKQLQELKKRWQAIEKNQADIPTEIHDPSNGVYAPSQEETALRDAREIIARGAPPDKVKERLAKQGIDPNKL